MSPASTAEIDTFQQQQCVYIEEKKELIFFLFFSNVALSKTSASFTETIYLEAIASSAFSLRSKKLDLSLLSLYPPRTERDRVEREPMQPLPPEQTGVPAWNARPHTERQHAATDPSLPFLG